LGLRIEHFGYGMLLGSYRDVTGPSPHLSLLLTGAQEQAAPPFQSKTL